MLIQTKIIKALEEELKLAKDKEQRAARSSLYNKEDLIKAMSFTNGLYRAIDTVRRIKQ
ncbi:MAG: hypothetical protein GY861_03390 [bacterium]|nr:hypothetical protein [bacterium]